LKPVTPTTARHASGDVELNAEPTTYTTAANMEGVVAADVYIPPASAGIQGLVNNLAGNTLGTPILGKTDGVAVADGYVGQMVGTEHASTTVGSSFSTQSNTALTNTAADVVSVTLQPGLYIVSVAFSGYQSDGALRDLLYGIAVNSIMVTQTFTIATLAATTRVGISIGGVPILIKTATTVSLRAYVASMSGSWSNPVNEIWATRIS
jgi:hypothetical protein